MERPTLTVCIPNYNHAQYISEALEYVLAQSFPPTEIIVIDDASTDNSIDVIEGFIKRNSNIRLIRNFSNQGTFKSVNHALAEATGEVFYQLPADDKVLSGFFEKSIHLLQKYPEAGMCATYPRYIDALGNPTKFPSYHSHETHVNIRTPRFLSTTEVLSRISRQPWFLGGATPVLFRRSALLEAGGLIPELGLLADWFAVHYVALKYGMCYIPEPLVAFRVMPNSLGANIVRQPKIVMEQLVRAYRLMQEPKYRQVFPESFIDLQRGNFTYTPFRGALVIWQTNFLKELHNLVPPQTLLGKGMMRVLCSLMKFQWLMLKLYCYRNIPPVFKQNFTHGN